MQVLGDRFLVSSPERIVVFLSRWTEIRVSCPADAQTVGGHQSLYISLTDFC